MLEVRVAVQVCEGDWDPERVEVMVDVLVGVGAGA